MNKDQLQALLDAQQQVISLIALGHPLSGCLNAICELIEGILESPVARSSVLLLHGKQLRHGAAPHLPTAYCEAIDGVEIGEAVGSCGTAAYRKQQVIVTDIATDPLWHNFKDIALGFDLQACWSNPIFSKKGEVLGTFAIYYAHPFSPKRQHLELIDRFTHLTSLAIERARSSEKEESLRHQLMLSNEKFTAITRVMPDMAFVLGADGSYTDLYGGDEKLLYKPRQDIMGKRVSDIIPSEIACGVMNTINETLRSGEIQIFEYDMEVLGGQRTFEGRVAPLDHYLPEFPDRRHVLWMARDITARKEAEQQIERLAYYDPLTGLPNRRMLINRLEVLLESIRRKRKFGALLYLDLDNFKRINDSLGHSAGDELLIQVAERLSPNLRKSDTLARIGGDEFVVMLETLEDDVDALCKDASQVAQKIIESFEHLFSVRGGDYKLGCSIGIGLIDRNTSSADEVLKRADTAMYKSKHHGGNDFTFFDPELQRIIEYRLELEHDIRRAIQASQFEAWFQPQLTPAGDVIGAEALIRWHHPKKGVVSPIEFIPIAEQFGLIDQLQSAVLRDTGALLDLFEQSSHAGIQALAHSFSVAVNISALQFKNPEFKDQLLAQLAQQNHPPTKFKLEITESMLVEDVLGTLQHMAAIKAAGFRFSVDDFGTGYSSLTYLQSFPIDELKIDRSFVNRMQEEKVGTAIVDAIIALSQHLHFKVVAEGVETEAQAQILSDKQIHAMQGYLFAKPMPAKDFMRWLEAYQDQR